MVLRRRALGCLAVAIFGAGAGCWSLTTDLDVPTGGGPDGASLPVGDASTVDDTVLDGSPTNPSGDAGVDGDASGGDSDYCTAARAAAGAATLKECFVYDGIDAGSLKVGGFGPVTTSIVSSHSRTPPSSLAFSFASLESTSAGTQHEIPVGFAPKRLDLAFDVQVDVSTGVAPDRLHLGGLVRADVYTYLLYDVAAKRIYIAEQDQRVSPFINSQLKGAVDVDLTSWKRIELSVSFETSRISSRVIGGGAAPNIVLEMTANAPGTSYVGVRYASGSTAPFVMRYDNVVVLGF